ncbi:nucleoside hydrolase [Pigmentibacter sp. JX0631]|uniref:nucleoside hydrolase n=1 Tax=Pigmentibacter sp. JX0631 TaxID=2976982 RepID=UPI0024699307|nr:nucleoside hydrolase [Pigmentibacter sp. JX0631]WGL60085.1 nucleoside hydrolase [Pigmentibacter sp. JX0631]
MIFSKYWKIIYILFSLFSFNFGHAYEKEAFPLIIDTDAAIDDWPAVLYSLNQKAHSDLLGITISATGEAHCKPAQKNIADLIYLSGRESEFIPVTCGDSVPLEGFHTFPDEWRITSDSLFDVKIPSNPTPHILTKHSVEWMHETLSKSKKPVVFLTIGPLTNLGQLIQKYPDDVKKIKRIYIMGGAIKAKGNLNVPNITENLQNKYAEWNIWIDPLSAKIVFNSGVPLSVIPLDASNQVRVTREFLKKLKSEIHSKSAQFYADILDKNLDFIDSGEYYFWDVLSTASMYMPFCTEKKVKLDVVTKFDPSQSGKEQMKSFGKNFSLVFAQFEGNMQNRHPFEQIESGRTIEIVKQDKKLDHVMCFKVDGDVFKDHFIKTLNNSKE